MVSDSEVESILFGPARGGRRVASLGPLEVEVVRGLTPDDLPALQSAPPGTSVAPSGGIKALRHNHHLLARALAEGRGEAEASLITGYSPSRISVLKSDPTFRELLVHYGANRELAFVDAAERMAAVGLTALEELAARLDEKPEDFSDGKLMELVDLTLVKGRASPGARSGPTGAQGGVPLVQISFVQPPGTIIDHAGAGEPPNGA